MRQKHTVIPQKFKAQFGENAIYAFKSCIKELSQDFNDLKHYLEIHEVPNARLILHNMLGVSQILGNKPISLTTLKIQNTVKNVADFDYPHHDMAIIEIELMRLQDGLTQENKLLKVLIFSSVLPYEKIQEELAICPEVGNVLLCKDRTQLEEQVSKECPDIVITLNDLSYEVHEVAYTESRYLGSSFIKLSDQEEFKIEMLRMEDKLQDYSNPTKEYSTNVASSSVLRN